MIKKELSHELHFHIILRNDLYKILSDFKEELTSDEYNYYKSQAEAINNKVIQIQGMLDHLK